jgi:hypothetical protein
MPIAATPLAIAAPMMPEPIYWKQHLFLIPYQWSSAAQSGAAQSVILYVSCDRGASWQKISEAKPQVKAFNYRAEGDGEYWFAVRTLDNRGRVWPEGTYQPELRVVVDTTIPRIDELFAAPAADGAIEIECRATDVNLDPRSFRVEAQANSAAAWQPVVLQAVADPSAAGKIQARWQNVGAAPSAIRATISDRAGNSAVYQTTIGQGPRMSGPLLSQPSTAATNNNPFEAAMAASSAVAQPVASAAPAAPAQQWQPNVTSRAPFRLWTSGTTPQDDGMTAYGTPQVAALPMIANEAPVTPSRLPAASGSGGAVVNPAAPRVPAQYTTATLPDGSISEGGWSSAQTTGPQMAPLEPYREPAGSQQLSALPPTTSITPIGSPTHQPTSPPKLVGSRTFALEYDLEGTGGIAKVELWGTRDGGQTWNRYAQDDDNRSPLVATVDSEGLYGFKIVAQTAGTAAAEAPRPGEEPELWVAVDLKRPIVELTSIERGEGNLADHLMIHWRVQDNNLEKQPISLYFSSRPGGPWSAIATNLEDTGNYSWRVERYVPSRIYLRIEARDTAGNLAAFQTREPVEFDSRQVTARLRAH